MFPLLKLKNINPFLSIFFLIIFIPSYIFSQEVDIVPYLKEVKEGNKKLIEEKLPELKKNNPNSSSIIYLEALLTEDGDKAVNIFSDLISKYPNSQYADASLYRIYSYHFALGLYEQAEKHFDRLKEEYPFSPYIKLAEADISSQDEFAADEPEITPAAAPTKTLDSKAQFTIQAGAFSNPANAKNLKKDFDNAGYFSEIREKNVGGTNFHVVYVGSFSNNDEAESFLSAINSKYNLAGKVITRTW